MQSTVIYRALIVLVYEQNQIRLEDNNCEKRETGLHAGVY